jgi:alkylation response protein AidB-like acyl-CoA dehydrogenase
MDFDPSEEQRLLADSLRRFVERDYGFEARRSILASPAGYNDAAWASLAGLGVLALPVPAEYGGFGAGAADLGVVMEAIGEALVVEPFLETAGLGARFVARGGSDELKAAILPALAEGKVKMAFAQAEEGSRHDLARVGTRARKVDGGYRIDGVKRVVVQAPCADRLVVSARTSGEPGDREGVSLFVVDAKAPGLTMKACRTVDGLRAADIAFDAVRVEAGALLAREGEGLPLAEEVVDFATALVCAEAVGAIRSANEATLEYLKTRHQFGVAIGSFQALQHRMVDMAISYEQARSMASLACARVDAERDPAARGRVVSAAKVRIAEACRHVSQESIQLHGGMGMSEELKVSHTFRRLTVIAQQFGDADHHLERFARLS